MSSIPPSHFPRLGLEPLKGFFRALQEGPLSSPWVLFPELREKQVHCQEELTQTVIVCWLKTPLFSLIEGPARSDPVAAALPPFSEPP